MNNSIMDFQASMDSFNAMAAQASMEFFNAMAAQASMELFNTMQWAAIVLNGFYLVAKYGDEVFKAL
jgi:hypothetical protein